MIPRRDPDADVRRPAFVPGVAAVGVFIVAMTTFLFSRPVFFSLVGLAWAISVLAGVLGLTDPRTSRSLRMVLLADAIGVLSAGAMFALLLWVGFYPAVVALVVSFASFATGGILVFWHWRRTIRPAFETQVAVDMVRAVCMVSLAILLAGVVMHDLGKPDGVPRLIPRP